MAEDLRSKTRCPWVPLNDDLYVEYHDEEWGREVRDDKLLFRKLMLDAFQAGLSWRTILYKRDNFLAAFDNFDPEIVSKYSEDKVQELMANAGIVRNQAKIRATIHNSKVFLDEFPRAGNFSKFLWGFVGGSTIINHPEKIEDYQATSPESDRMSKELKQKGFKFVGSTVCYAFMQAVGMIDDHSVDCFRSKVELV